MGVPLHNSKEVVSVIKFLTSLAKYIIVDGSIVLVRLRREPELGAGWVY